MNKPELITAVAEKTGMKKKDVEAMLDAFIDVVKETLKKGDKVALIGFGTWATRERAKRNGVNPRTGKKISIPAKVVPYFKVGKELKDAVSK
ncbi:HU family DNA-binding protein [Caldisericum exile]|uniref:DNA-binding protein HU n=1 Tax=Caldisericum exile (strain DSM 21853 / NBRC 104410 / AZM16c01) TaxID=511051 RepID=A0A7U6JFD6_CALEA|nr:HU family DNA-binding protein [Caldisericum exile]BAL80329.1 DNA-binding protein HU [Caldisericum exile AZM16c01]